MVKAYVVRTREIKRLLIERIKNIEYDALTEVIFKPYKHKRSNQQNSLYWKWLKVISDETGYTDDEMHSYFKYRFLPPITEKKIFDLEINDRITTTKLNTKQFTEYLNHIEVFTNTEIGFNLPHPEDLYYAAMGIKI